MDRKIQILPFSLSLNVPSEYTKVNYLSSPATDWWDTWIDTGYHIQENTAWIVDGIFKSGISNGNYMGFWTRYAGGMGMGSGNSTSREMHMVRNTQPCKSLGEEYMNSRHLFKLYHGDYYADDMKTPMGHLTDTYSATCEYPLLLFGHINPSYQGCGGITIYKSMIYEDEIIKHYYVPCYRNSDNKPGFYDVVVHEFLTNNTGSNLVCG